MTNPPPNYKLHIIFVRLVGLLSFALTFLVLSFSRAQLRADSINVLIETSGVIFGFGGTVFAVLSEERSLIAKHRGERSKMIERVIEETNLPTYEKNKKPFAKLAKKIRDHDFAIMKAADIYMFLASSFRLGFYALALSLILQLIHRVGFRVISNVTLCGISATSILVSVEIGLISVGVAAFVAAWSVTLDLPLPPE